MRAFFSSFWIGGVHTPRCILPVVLNWGHGSCLLDSRRFARLAFIQSYRERQNNPALAAQQAAAGTSEPTPAAPTPAPAPPPLPTSTSGVTLRLAGPTASGVSTPTGGAGSPPSTTNPRPKKKLSVVNANTPAATESDGTPAPSGSSGPRKLTKKQMAAAAKAGLSFDPNDPTLPTDPVEKEKVLDERMKLLAVQQRKDAKARTKEKKRLAELAVASGAAGDLQVGGVGTPVPATPGAKFSWSGGQ